MLEMPSRMTIRTSGVQRERGSTPKFISAVVVGLLILNVAISTDGKSVALAAQVSLRSPKTAKDGSSPAVQEQTTSSPSSPWEAAAGGKMSFEVASIRPSASGKSISANFPFSADDSFSMNGVSPGGLLTANFPLIFYIEFAYKLWLSPDQRAEILSHLPKWVGTDLYEIRARASDTPTKDQMRLMMQSLLAERFHLVLHFEDRPVPVFALSLIKPGKVGPQLHPHSEGPLCEDEHSSRSTPPAPASSDLFPSLCYASAAKRTPPNKIMAGARNVTMQLIAASLSTLPGQQLGRPVVDQSGLRGNFDFTIEWVPETSPSSELADDTAPEASGSTFLNALHEQLGLTLKATKAALPVPVVDHVERPSEN